MEFALVLPLLLLLVAGCLDFGRVWHHEIIVGNSARIAASTAALRTPTEETREQWEQDVRQAAADELSQLGEVEPDQLDISIEMDANDPPAWVRVEVNYPFETVINWPTLPQRIVLHESAVNPLTD